jgi:hypothetical protein
MTKDLVKFDTNQYLNPDKTLKFLADSRKFVQRTFKDNPKAAMQALSQVSAIQVMSAKIKLPEIQREALVAKLNIQRDIGALLIPIIKRGCKSPEKEAVKLQQLGINYDESKVWQRFASVPDYAWDFAMQQPQYPAKSQMLAEIKRFNEISHYLNKVKDTRVDPIMLKEYYTHGYSLDDVQIELNKVGIKDSAHERQVKRAFNRQVEEQAEEDAEVEEAGVTQEDVDAVVALLSSNSDGFEHVADQLIAFYNSLDDVEIDARDRENIQISMTKIHERSADLFKAFNRMQTRLGWRVYGRH